MSKNSCLFVSRSVPSLTFSHQLLHIIHTIVIARIDICFFFDCTQSSRFTYVLGNVFGYKSASYYKYRSKRPRFIHTMSSIYFKQFFSAPSANHLGIFESPRRTPSLLYKKTGFTMNTTSQCP